MGWVFHFGNRFLGQKPFDEERHVSWSIVTLENPIVGPKFSPFSLFLCLNLVAHSCSYVVGYQRFGGPCCLHLQELYPENGGSIVLRKVGLLPHQ
jgi:hypothetical protein